MTGWRIGYLAAARIHRTFNGTMNAAVQRAALAAVTRPSDGPALRCAEFDYRRQLALGILADVEGISVNAPDGAFYLFVKSLEGLTSREMLLGADEFGVAIRAGNEYGPSGEGRVRIAFSSSREDVQEGMTRLRHMFRALSSARGRAVL